MEKPASLESDDTSFYDAIKNESGKFLQKLDDEHLTIEFRKILKLR